MTSKKHPLVLFREGRNLQQKDLLGKIKNEQGKPFSIATISNIEKGKTPFKEFMLKGLRESFEMSQSELSLFSEENLSTANSNQPRYTANHLSQAIAFVKTFPDGVTQESLIKFLDVIKKEN